ncbi:MAG: adenylosuccinate synthetase [Acidiphilium sp.]
MRLVLVLSGPVGVGKTSFADALARRFQVRRVSTRQHIIRRLGTSNDRAALQAAGSSLDQQTNGAWVADAVAEEVETSPPNEILLVDSARIKSQVRQLRSRFGSKLHHVHLTAPIGTLRERYLARSAETKEFATYEELYQNATEAAIESLASLADVTLDTARTEPEGLVALAMAGTGFYPKPDDALVDVVVGGQYGSEGKGNVCAYLANEYGLLVRVGGPNAGHKVADPDHTFVQLPSGALHNRGAKLLIGPGATLSLAALRKDMDAVGVAPGRLFIDGQAMIIEESDIAHEATTMEVIGSTKKGVGIATARKIIGRGDRVELGAPVRLAREIEELKSFITPAWRVLEDAYAAGTRIMLEGTQGTELSLHHGSYPHVTSRETTASGCMADAGIAPGRVRKVIMVTRTYPIRVGGTSGPIGIEIEPEVIANRSDIPLDAIRKTEVGSISGKPRRMAEFDFERVRRAAVLNGATEIALTFADYLAAANAKAKSYDELTPDTRHFVDDIESVTGVRVALISTRFHRDGMIDRRNPS